MSRDTLNTLVTGAIWRAEQLEDLGVASAPLAWAEVSKIEEQLAACLAVTTAEGKIARRGAVRAALKAGDVDRASALAQSYLADTEAPQALREALHEMFQAHDRVLSERFPYAAQRVPDARVQARQLHRAGAFGLAFAY